MSRYEELAREEQRLATTSDAAARAANIALHELDMSLPGTSDHDQKRREFEAARIRFAEASRLWEQAKAGLDAHVRTEGGAQ
ncbi:hypothetical protein [Dyella japonica]|uniref:Uncharacterized protein n=1 Tax=Dyella japonica A8 TaxID=1217721 RepID=A0A075JW46_9GAMM|nr:hypothetical protein [Dyella japonica]AIF46336.1 hypothetical protein HY57_03235 [Dyella japonica A8]